MVLAKFANIIRYLLCVELFTMHVQLDSCHYRLVINFFEI